PGQLGRERAVLNRVEQRLERLSHQVVVVLGDLVRGAQRRLDGLQAQEPVGEAVNRADVGGVETGQGVAEERRARLAEIRWCELFEQALADSQTELARRLPGEGDGRQ